MTPATTGEALTLTDIREELQLMKGAPTISGKPTWLIFDPVQHRYFEIDFTIYQILSLWNRSSNADDLVEAAKSRFGSDLDHDKVRQVAHFIDINNLAVEAANGGWRMHNFRHESRQISPLSWILHNYLFMRFPLVRPSRFLKALLPHVAFAMTRAMLIVTLVVGLAGLYLVSRQWDEFVSTFANFFSLEGALAYGLTLVVIKILHELGHALMAVRYGCRVPTMGVAFLVMFPVLYTDITDAWKLRSRRQRLMIAGAGMMVELALACFATFLWSFLPEGNLKSLAFIVATITWIMSVAINLNPLMRFDGYYLLSDALGLGNLQSRAFAFGRWRLREILFDLKSPPPEQLPGRTGLILTIYAWSVWVYRFFLFLGIALLVYAYFFKALGLFLFFVEVVWFIARPLWSELKEWFAMKSKIIRRPRTWLAAAVWAGLSALVVLPVSGRIEVPVVVEPARFERIFPPHAAKLTQIAVTAGQHVRRGDVLFRFRSRDIEHKRELAEIRKKLLEARIDRSTADRKDKALLMTLRQERHALIIEIDGYRRQMRRLVVRAPISGKLVDLNPDLHVGRWNRVSDHLVTIAGEGRHLARGYVRERDLWRLSRGDRGKFFPDNFQIPSSSVRIRDISLSNAGKIDLLPLASVFGGPVATRLKDAKTLVPVDATYQVTLDIDASKLDNAKVIRGIANVSGRPESLAARIWRQTLRVLVRESGA